MRLKYYTRGRVFDAGQASINEGWFWWFVDSMMSKGVPEAIWFFTTETADVGEEVFGESPPTYDVLDMPDPGVKALSYRFKLDREDVVNGDEDLEEFTDKKIADFKAQIWNDGWVMIESEGVAIMEKYDIDFNQYKIRVEVVAARREKNS